MMREKAMQQSSSAILESCYDTTRVYEDQLTRHRSATCSKETETIKLQAYTRAAVSHDDQVFSVTLGRYSWRGGASGCSEKGSLAKRKEKKGKVNVVNLGERVEHNS